MYLPPRRNAQLQRERHFQASHGGCGIRHMRIKKLFVGSLGEEERLSITLHSEGYWEDGFLG